jgi:lysozyme
MSFAHGIDVSQNQPKVDWPTVKTAGIDFVLVRASVAGTLDTLFAQHWAGAKSAGLLRGAYHFLTQRTDVQTQIQTYLRAAAGDPGELPVILDIEASITDAATYAAMAQNWLHAVEGQLQRRPIIYTGAWWWDPNMLLGGRYPDWASTYRLWVAAYPLKASVPSRDQIEQRQFTPDLPKSWTNWMFWQYSGDVAFLDGITTDLGRPAHVDLDVFNGTVDDLRALAQMAAPVTVADPAPSPTNPAVVPAPVGRKLPDARVTNQIMINAFRHAFGAPYWDVVTRAGLTSIAEQREVPYSGPAIQALSNLTDAEQAALQQQLSQIVGNP